jgi:hypothetical protein
VSVASRGFSLSGRVPALLVQSGPAAWCILLAGLYCILALASCAPRTAGGGNTLSRSATSPVPHTATTVPHTATMMPRSARRVPHRTSTVPHAAVRGSHITTAPSARIPQPDQSLLDPQPPPDCAFKGPLSNPATAEETRMKLDYEQQCYRHSEMIVRARLQQLQSSVQEATKPSSRRKQEKTP